jgi:hypothetical protein
MLTQHEWIYVIDLVHFKDSLVLMQFKQKKMSYCNQHSTDQFLPLAIGVFGCLQKQIFHMMV